MSFAYMDVVVLFVYNQFIHKERYISSARELKRVKKVKKYIFNQS